MKTSEGKNQNAIEKEKDKNQNGNNKKKYAEFYFLKERKRHQQKTMKRILGEQMNNKENARL